MSELAKRATTLTRGDRIVVRLTNGTYQSDRFDLDEPYETTVQQATVTERDREDSYHDPDSGMWVRTRSDVHEIQFDPHPNDNMPDAYVFEVRAHKDGHYEMTEVKRRWGARVERIGIARVVELDVLERHSDPSGESSTGNPTDGDRRT